MTVFRRALVAGLAAVAGASILPPTTSTALPSALVLAPDRTPTDSPALANSTSISGSTAAAAAATPRACNNSPELCDRAFNNVTFMGAHDSAFLRDYSTGNSLAGNQYLNATHALDAGIRLLQAQVHLSGSTLELCHTLCDLLNAGPLERWLASIHDWMEQHPNDVVTILLVNSDHAGASALATVFESSGLASLAFLPPKPDSSVPWPTLGQMIDRGTRALLVVTDVDPSGTVPYILSEFDYFFETPFTVTELDGFNCTLDRPSSLAVGGGAVAAKKGFLSIVNHFKDVAITSSILMPDVDNLETVNGANTSQQASLGRHMAECAAQWGTRPNFALVDFWNVGQVVQVADRLNGIESATVTGRNASAAELGGGSPSRGSDMAGNMNVATGALVVFLAMALTL